MMLVPKPRSKPFVQMLVWCLRGWLVAERVGLILFFEHSFSIFGALVDVLHSIKICSFHDKDAVFVKDGGLYTGLT